MDTFQSWSKSVRGSLEYKFGDRETTSILRILREDLFSSEVANATQSLSFQQINTLNTALMEILSGRPVQYVVGKALFYGRYFKVDSRVLIPRPETEELVHLILSNHQDSRINVIDLCSGSGCIGITLKLERPAWNVYALELSEDALAVSRWNAEKLGADLDFIKANLLEMDVNNFPEVDLIVSNPPYVLESDKSSLDPAITDHEPVEALFVDDAEPLVFYKQIMKLGLMKLKPGGSFYLEINEKYGSELFSLFTCPAINKVDLLTDMQGAKRFLVACTTT
jgi:release factor glutamine methyltransferase